MERRDWRTMIYHSREGDEHLGDTETKNIMRDEDQWPWAMSLRLGPPTTWTSRTSLLGIREDKDKDSSRVIVQHTSKPVYSLWVVTIV